MKHVSRKKSWMAYAGNVSTLSCGMTMLYVANHIGISEWSRLYVGSAKQAMFGWFCFQHVKDAMSFDEMKN